MHGYVLCECVGSALSYGMQSCKNQFLYSYIFCTSLTIKRIYVLLSLLFYIHILYSSMFCIKYCFRFIQLHSCDSVDCVNTVSVHLTMLCTLATVRFAKAKNN